jgi:nucleoside-diphosphate-sugar epimerase
MEKILLTGASGFLGKIILKELPIRIFTLGRSKEMDFVCDLSTSIPCFSRDFSVVIHAAGKAHSLPRNEKERNQFFEVNVNGLSNLLKGLEAYGKLPQSFILISSVSVYGLDSGININEEHPLNAQDPYGKSKIEAERLAREWCTLKDVRLTVLRLPLVAGSNPPGNLGAMINGIIKGYYMNIGEGNARKSIVLGSDVAKLIPKIASAGGIYNLTDGYNPSFFELSKNIASQLGKPPGRKVPVFLAQLIAKIGDLMGANAPINTKKLNKITSTLTFDDSKVKTQFNWVPTPVLEGLKI